MTGVQQGSGGAARADHHMSVSACLGVSRGASGIRFRSNAADVPGEASAFVTLFPCDPTTEICSNSSTGSGHATGLGRIVVTASTSRFGPFEPCAPLVGTRTITSALGSIYLSSTGTACLNGGGIIDADLEWVVTGGTGSLAGASGSGTETPQLAANPGAFHELFSRTLTF
jgi:hypothetical protein